MSASSKKWPCVFAGQFIKTQVNPRLYEQDPRTPFAGFQRAWRIYHCQEINPYGSESCPYTEQDCALAYLITAQRALGATTSKIGLFGVLAQKRGYIRAENKPLPREVYARTDGHESGAPDLRDGARARPGDGLGGYRRPGRTDDPQPMARPRALDLRGTDRRPQSLGDLLRGDGAGPRTQPYRRHEGQAAADHDGDTGDPVSPPSPERVGDGPPAGGPDVHQGGE